MAQRLSLHFRQAIFPGERRVRQMNGALASFFGDIYNVAGIPDAFQTVLDDLSRGNNCACPCRF